MVSAVRAGRRRMDLFDIANVTFLGLIGLSMVYPFLYMLAVSFSDPEYVMRSEVLLWPKGFHWKAYELVLSDPSILRGYRNTLFYVAAGTTISLALTVLTAYALARKELLFGRPVTLMIVFTMLFSGGMIPSFLVVKALGLLNTVWAMILPGAISAWNLFVMRTFFAGLPKELEESAKIDGAGDFGILLRIIAPLSKPVLATIGLFYAVAIWNNYYSALLYLRSESLYPLQVAIRHLLERGVIAGGGGLEDGTIDQTLKFATIIVGTLPIMMVYPFLQKHFVKGVLIGSVKG